MTAFVAMKSNGAAFSNFIAERIISLYKMCFKNNKTDEVKFKKIVILGPDKFLDLFNKVELIFARSAFYGR